MAKSEKGQALVELALVLPLLLLLLLGITQLGLVLATDLNLAQATRQGARLASLGATDEEVVQAVQAAATALDPGLIQVTVDPAAPRASGQQVTVSTGYPLEMAVPLPGLLPEPYHLSERVVMLVE